MIRRLLLGAVVVQALALAEATALLVIAYRFVAGFEPMPMEPNIHKAVPW